MTQGIENFDLFISYRHAGDDLNAAKSLKARLESTGLKVFMDDPGVETFESITQTIRESLSRSKALLCYFSEHYLAGRACIWELTAAYIAAQRQGGRPTDRIFILNPSDQRDQLKYLPPDLADANCASDMDTALDVLPQRLSTIQGTFQDQGPLTFPGATGRTLTGSTRFVGRLKEMWEIHSHLHESEYPIVNAGHMGPDMAIISGMGGLGKSLLAEEYALRFGAAYPGGIYWLEAHGSYHPDQPDVEAFKSACSEQFLKLLRSCGLKPPQDASYDELRAMMAGILADKKDHSLWIVDDIPYGLADHVDAVKAWFAPHPSASTLITTRSKEYGAIGREISLDILEESEAIELLEKHGITVENTENQAHALIERLGHHAMAVDIAGAAIKNTGSTINDYLTMLDRDLEDLLDVPRELVDALPSGHQRSIIKTFKHSIDRLNGPALDILRLAANLSPAPIRKEFMESVLGMADDLEEVQSKKATGLGIAGCRQLSLIKQTDEFLQVHALLSATMQYLNMAKDERGQRLLTVAMDRLSTLIRPDLDYEQAVNIAHEVEHARFLTSDVTDESRFELLQCLGDFDDFRGHVRMAKNDWERIVSIQMKEKGPDHTDTLRSKNNLSTTLLMMGDHKGAQDILEQILKQSNATHEKDNPEILMSMNNMAVTLHAMGDYQKARDIHEKTLERRKAFLGENDTDTLTSMNNLAETMRAMGDYTEAKALHEQALKLKKSTLGMDNTDTLTSMNNLAVILADMGDHNGAKALQEVVLKQRRALLGPDHPETLTSMNNMAETLRNIGDYNGARDIHEETLERRKLVLGTRHPLTTASAWNLFPTLAQMQDYQAAQKILNENLMWLLDESVDLQDAQQIQIRDALKEAVRANQPNPEETMSDDKRALKLMDRGDWAGAKVLWEPLLEQMIKTMPVNHPDRTYVAWHLFFCLDQLGEHDLAKDILREHLLWLVDADESSLGAFLKPMREEVIRLTTKSQVRALAEETTPDIQRGMELIEAGDWAGARAVWRPLFENLLEKLPARHPDATVAAFYLFACLHNLQESDGAEDVLKDHLAWLAHADESALDDRLKSIREQVLKMTN